MPDPEISRHACLLQVQDGYVMVFNQSRLKPLAMRPPVGEDQRVGPSSALTSLPHRTFDLIFAEAYDESVCVHVDARAMTPPLPPPSADGEEPTLSVVKSHLSTLAPNLAGRRPARTQAALLTPAQRLALIALCEPMLTANGISARPRSSTELAERLVLRPDYARNIIKDVRHRLADAGVPGLIPTHPAAATRTDLRLALARWAIEQGAVTAADLTDLPRAVGHPTERNADCAARQSP
jgi:hypothetical protein